MSSIPQDIAATDKKIEAIHALCISELSSTRYKTDLARVIAMLDEAAGLSRQVHNMKMLVLSLWRKGSLLRNRMRLDEAEQNYREALAIAEKHKLVSEVTGLLESLGHIALERGEFGEAEHLYSKAASVAGESGDTDGYARSMGSAALAALRYGNALSALKMCRRTIDICEQHGMKVPLSIYVHTGMAYMQLGEYSRALEYYMPSLELCDGEANPMKKANILCNLASVHAEREDHQAATRLLEEALGLYDGVEMDNYKAQTLIRLVLTLTKLLRMEEAGRYLAEARQIIGAAGLPALSCQMANASAIFHAGRGDRDLAREFYREQIATARASGETRLEIKGLYGLAAISAIEEKESLLLESLRIAHEKQQKKLVSEICLQLSACMEEKGDPVRALHYYKEYHAVLREILNQESERHKQVLQMEYEVNQLKKDLQIQQEKREYAETELERKKQELVSLSLQLGHIGKLVENIRFHARRGLQMSSGKTRLCFRQIMQTSGAQISPLQWDIFEDRFSHTYSDFIGRLQQRYPALSPAEIKVCALLKAGSSLKEAASLLCTSPRTLQNQSSSIRKKMGLGSKDNLASFIIAQ